MRQVTKRRLLLNSLLYKLIKIEMFYFIIDGLNIKDKNSVVFAILLFNAE
jgi:hypothetical protein